MSSEFSVRDLWSAIEPQLRDFCKLRHKQWLANVDEEQVLWTVMRAGENQDATSGPVAFVEGNVFCMYLIGRPWWGRRPVLQEEIMFALPHRPIDLGRALRRMEADARYYGCHGVVVGTSLSDRDEALCRALRSHGYNPVATELYKEIGAWDS